MKETLYRPARLFTFTASYQKYSQILNIADFLCNFLQFIRYNIKFANTQNSPFKLMNSVLCIYTSFHMLRISKYFWL